MNNTKRRWFGVVLFILAVCSLVFFRPVLRTLGVDLDHRVPGWADFFSPGQYDAFLGELTAYFHAAKLEIRIHDGTLYAEDGGEYGLRTLAQKCLQLRRDAWTDTIKRHFDQARPEKEESKPSRVRAKGNTTGEDGG